MRIKQLGYNFKFSSNVTVGPGDSNHDHEAGVLKIGLYKLKSYAGAGGISWNHEAGVLKFGLYKLKFTQVPENIS